MQVRSSGGNIAGMGTIHGNVEIMTAGHSVNNPHLFSYCNLHVFYNLLTFNDDIICVQFLES